MRLATMERTIGARRQMNDVVTLHVASIVSATKTKKASMLVMSGLFGFATSTRRKPMNNTGNVFRSIAAERHTHDGHEHIHPCEYDDQHRHPEEVPSPGNEPAVFDSCSIRFCETTVETPGQPCGDCYRELGVGG